MTTKTPSLTIDADRHEVFVGKREVKLAPREYLILKMLKDSGKTISREHFLSALWPGKDHDLTDSRTIDQHISRLRRKIKAPYIATVSNFGYRWDGDKLS